MTTAAPHLVEHSAGYSEYWLPVSVKLVVDIGGRVPLRRNERNEWELPGGKLEFGESPEQTGRREIAEELGLTLTGPLQLLDTWVYQITPHTHAFIVTYGTSHTGGKLTPEPDDEIALFGYDQIPGLHMPEPYKTSITTWRSRST